MVDEFRHRRAMEDNTTTSDKVDRNGKSDRQGNKVPPPLRCNQVATMNRENKNDTRYSDVHSTTRQNKYELNDVHRNRQQMQSSVVKENNAYDSNDDDYTTAEEENKETEEDTAASEDDHHEHCFDVKRNTSSTTKFSSGMWDKENSARNQYDGFLAKLGIVDNDTVLQETVRRTTRKQAWKNFKLVDENDYHHDSSFAKFIFQELGINRLEIPSEVQRQELWLKFKKYVCEGMQAARSSATQAIKKQFIGKWKSV
jgi:hypothetical protein